MYEMHTVYSIQHRIALKTGYQLLRKPDNLITRFPVKPSLFEPVYQNETLTIMNPDMLLITKAH